MPGPIREKRYAQLGVSALNGVGRKKSFFDVAVTDTGNVDYATILHVSAYRIHKIASLDCATLDHTLYEIVISGRAMTMYIETKCKSDVLGRYGRAT
jgi:hypothetical protein